MSEDDVKPDGDLDKGVTVDLSKKPDETKKEGVPQKEDSLVISASELKKLQSTIAFQSRKQEELMKRLNDIAEAMKPIQPQVAGNGEVLDEIDKMADSGDWKGAVRKLGEEVAYKVFENRMKELQTKESEESKKKLVEDELERSSQRVLEEYPQLQNQDSEEAQFYRQAAQEISGERPLSLQSPYFPELVKDRMEKNMRAAGKAPASFRASIDSEVQRRTRVQSGSVIGKTPSSDSNKYHLTQEQKRVADAGNIPYEEYAKIAQSLEKKGVVEV